VGHIQQASQRIGTARCCRTGRAAVGPALLAGASPLLCNAQNRLALREFLERIDASFAPFAHLCFFALNSGAVVLAPRADSVAAGPRCALCPPLRLCAKNGAVALRPALIRLRPCCLASSTIHADFLSRSSRRACNGDGPVLPCCASVPLADARQIRNCCQLS
jgi:hypothetical protein